jgi:hypothetical protein
LKVRAHATVRAARAHSLAEVLAGGGRIRAGAPRALCAPNGKAQHPAASPDPRSAESWAMPALTRQQKITFEEMRESGVRGVLIYCADHKCSRGQSFRAFC